AGRRASRRTLAAVPRRVVAARPLVRGGDRRCQHRRRLRPPGARCPATAARRFRDRADRRLAARGLRRAAARHRARPAPVRRLRSLPAGDREHGAGGRGRAPMTRVGWVLAASLAALIAVLIAWFMRSIEWAEV